MCFPNSMYILIHTNIIKAFPAVNVELISIDHIATSCGFSNETGVTLTDGKIQNLVRKITDSLERVGHQEIDFSLNLEQEPNISVIDTKLDSGDIVLAGFSSGIYTRYFKKAGRKRPCIETLEDIGIDLSPPHYVSLIGIDKTKLGIIDPYCKYTCKDRPIERQEFINDNRNLVEIIPKSEFYQKILLNSRMDGIDILNRELIYSEVILRKDEKSATSKSGSGVITTSNTDSLDTFFNLDEPSKSEEEGGNKIAK